jgi:hypothetical protein
LCKIKPSAKILTTISTVKMAMNTGSNSSCKKRRKKELEPVCNKKWPKIIPGQLLVWGDGDV